MDYAEFEVHITQMATSATDGACRRFALETIRIVHRLACPALPEDLCVRERGMLSALMEGLEHRPVEELIVIYDGLLESMTLDDERAISYHHDVIELMGVLDNWLKYRNSGDPAFIVQIAIGMINSIDAAHQEAGRDYSADDMLGTAEMREEFSRIKQLLFEA
jgi:hypothetical protein